MGRGAAPPITAAAGLRLIERADREPRDLLHQIGASLRDLEELDVAALDELREQLGSIGQPHGLQRRWAIIDAPVGYYGPDSGRRHLAYGLDDHRDAAFWPSRFAGMDDDQAGELLASELSNLGQLASAARRRTAEKLALLEAIATPLPTA